MNLLGAAIVFALALLAVFTLANWSVLVAPTTLSFVVFELQGPLGVILLAAMLVLLALFVLYALALRTRMLMESRRQQQELQALRKLADSAETSRFDALRALVERENAALRDALGGVEARLDRSAQTVRQSLEESANGLAALVGEMDDKIDRALARAEPNADIDRRNA